MLQPKTNIIFLCLVFFSLDGICQFYTEENTREAREMIAICNSYTFLELYKSDKQIIPEGYKKRFTSGVFGMDNKYQIYETPTSAVINLRGSTAKKISWMENIYASMIPAKGEIKLEERTFVYEFTAVDNAGVHSGYALGIAFLAEAVIDNIKSLNGDGIYNITITGHSQGGALAILLRAYLENLPKGVISKKNTFKTYAFAHPKIGNRMFVDACSAQFEKGTYYSIVNVKDIVPQLPLSPGERKKISTGESVLRMFLDTTYNAKDAALEAMRKMTGGSVSKILKRTSASAGKQITKKVGDVEMPPIMEKADYVVSKNRIELAEVEYPKILMDSTVLKNESLMTLYKLDENGVFEDESLYKKEPPFFQHKTYNYYTAFLNKYFPKAYDELRLKYLPEDL
ncbi:MAG: hypothetical protein ACI9J3_000594 [Parvicellaceae bacterium]|jgi:hypothetical protein